MLQRFAFGIFTLLATQCALAAPQTHDGFFLQFNAGAGHQRWSGNSQGAELTIEGRSSKFDFALGGTILPNLVLFAQFTGTGAAEPAVNLTVDQRRSDFAPRIDQTMSIGLGAGLAYYLPDGIYLAGSVISMRLKSQNRDIISAAFPYPNEPVSTDDGVGIQARLGKEWWVSEEWGLGIAISYLRAQLPDRRHPDVDWTANDFGLTFSATYN